MEQQLELFDEFKTTVVEQPDLSGVPDSKLLYIAGFLDGEGCFQWKEYTAKVTAANTHLPSLLKIQKYLGGTVRLRNVGVNGNSRTCYEWYVYGDNAVNVCKRLLSFLREKQTQAALVLACKYETRPDKRQQLSRMLGELKRL